MSSAVLCVLSRTATTAESSPSLPTSPLPCISSAASSSHRQICHRHSAVAVEKYHPRRAKTGAKINSLCLLGFVRVGGEDIQARHKPDLVQLRPTHLEDAGSPAKKACSDAASSSWLRPCSKKTNTTQALGVSNAENPESPSFVNEELIDDVLVLADEIADDAPVLVDVKAEMDEFDNDVERRRLDRLAGSRRQAPR
ncbi:hypothetical protein AALP_AA8G310800 [Arabis alpina]|uniref:Uncharacterized protein n=1 Tax=Arabis alpina TaxID=50452 RepID=A0A087GAM3_ARAAL|nr:hypothetical protein AALP_AA8G310800 [Arabis alpina]